MGAWTLLNMAVCTSVSMVLFTSVNEGNYGDGGLCDGGLLCYAGLDLNLSVHVF